MIADAGQDIGDIELGVETVELGALDQRIERGGAMPAGIGTGEEVILATDRDTAQGTFGRVVVERPAAVVKAARECCPARTHIAEGGGQFGFARQFSRGVLRPGLRRRGNRH